MFFDTPLASFFINLPTLLTSPEKIPPFPPPPRDLHFKMFFISFSVPFQSGYDFYCLEIAGAAWGGGLGPGRRGGRGNWNIL